MAEQHGERVSIYPQQELANGMLKKFPQAFELGTSGLPENYIPISLPFNFAFSNSGERLVAHGGNSIEEVIVPLVHIAKKED